MSSDELVKMLYQIGDSFNKTSYYIDGWSYDSWYICF